MQATVDQRDRPGRSSAGTNFPRIAESGQIGPLRFKNRLLLAPMGTNYSTTDGFSTDRDRRYYVERAKGGAAMVMTEAMVMSEKARNHRNSLCCFHDRFIPGLAALVEAIKEQDCHVFGQLSHRGGLLKRAVGNAEPVGPSVWRNPNTGDDVRALTIAEIHDIQKEFVAAAKRMYKAGYDGIELHGANGYLFHQFFTPRVNKRTDEYGGPVANRGRFLLETVARIKDELPDWPLLVRVSCTEYTEGSYPVEDVVELGLRLQEAGVAALDLSGGTNEHPELSRFCIQPPSMPRRTLEPYARPIKQALDIPVIIAGRIIDPEDAEAVLANGSADFVSLGRALFADPYWPLKAMGKLDRPIRKCISCNVCFERLTLELDVSCVQNPLVGTEFEDTRIAEPAYPGRPLSSSGNTLVLGGGVAGLEAARVLTSLGHRVEIWEKSHRLGGQVPLAMAAPDKTEVEPVWSYRFNPVRDSSAEIRLSTEATAETLAAFRPDFVVVATGAVPRTLTIPGARPDDLGDSWDILANPDKVAPGTAVTIIGGGMVGIELAHLLTTRDCQVTIIEATSVVAAQMARNNKYDILYRLREVGTRIILDTVVDRLEADRLVLRSRTGTSEIPRDPHLVVAIGPQPENSVTSLLDRLAIPYAVVGDALKPGDFMSAIRDGWMVGLAIATGRALPSTTRGRSPAMASGDAVSSA
jgi:2,4-dienoyl-CoA reductase-like NADH-dependent reductase (Old Yellow Enzyme family)/thioredoxin reductase